jgi:hypothetical protein
MRAVAISATRSGRARGCSSDPAGRPPRPYRDRGVVRPRLAVRRDADHELIPVGRIDRHRHPDRMAVLIVGRAEVLEDGHAAVLGQPEERGLGRIRSADRDDVAVADLVDAKLAPQVLNSALGDVAGLDEPALRLSAGISCGLSTMSRTRCRPRSTRCSWSATGERAA